MHGRLTKNRIVTSTFEGNSDPVLKDQDGVAGLDSEERNSPPRRKERKKVDQPAHNLFTIRRLVHCVFPLRPSRLRGGKVNLDSEERNSPPRRKERKKVDQPAHNLFTIRRLVHCVFPLRPSRLRGGKVKRVEGKSDLP